MAKKKFQFPPAPPVGSDTPFDNIVGIQQTTGGGLTLGTFEFTRGIYEKVNRKFDQGIFSKKYNLENLDITDIAETKRLIQENFKVYPNFDISQVTSFTLYGSLQKRISTSVTKIINYFPAALEVYSATTNLTTGLTVTNIFYDPIEDETELEVDAAFARNPFEIDYSVNSARNIEVRPMKVSKYRDLTNEFTNYSLCVKTVDNEFQILELEPTDKVGSGYIFMVVKGNPFSGQSDSTETIIIKPNKMKTQEILKNDFDEVEKFLLNTETFPKYTASFSYPEYSDDGAYVTKIRKITWTLDGLWNLDIISSNFETYLDSLNLVCENLDEFKTNLISRFLITGSLKDFDTSDQRMEKILQIYGRSFDEVKKFIDALANMNSVNYKIQNDIPSVLLTNLAQTLGMNTNISPINNEDLLNSLFKVPDQSSYQGQSQDSTPQELNYQYYRNLILNSAYMFKTKGTRQSLEYIMRFIGAPEALTEFNEIVYLADTKINVDDFKEEYVNISAGSVYVETPVLDPTNVFSIQGVTYTGFTTDGVIQNNSFGESDFPIDENGFPKTPKTTGDYFFQKGSGWFEQTPKHRSPQEVDLENSELNQNNPLVITKLKPYSFGQEFLDRYRKFPFLNKGYTITKISDNQKSWPSTSTGVRKNDVNFNGVNYTVQDDRLVINSKNIELNVNIGQGLIYDVWDMSVKFNYPIPNSGLTSPYPYPGAIDWTFVNPKPKEKTFFEFAQTFFNNLINVRNRQYINDGKTGGYPALQSIYWKYLQSEETVGIPSNKFTYQKMIDYTLGLGNHWQRLLEQVVPATTLWLTGAKYENSIFHRQKFVYRRQRGCVFIPVECIPCEYNGQVFAYDCIDQTLTCNLSNITSSTGAVALNSTLQNFLQSQGVTAQQCDTNSIVSNWFIDCRLDNNILIQESFYNGFGPNDTPTQTEILNAINDKLIGLYNYGLNYYLAGNTLIVSNSTCYDDFTNKTLYLNIGVNININCDNTSTPTPTPTPICFGYLYNWYAATDVRNIAASGWEVPTISDYQVLADYLGAAGNYLSNTVGGKLKVTGLTYWISPNLGATNEVGFNGVGSAGRTLGGFSTLGLNAGFWTRDNPFATLGYLGQLYSNDQKFACVNNNFYPKKDGYSLRLKKITTTLSNGQTGTYVGNDGKTYTTICIGTQEWLSQNLTETKYSDLTDIPNVSDQSTWDGLTTGAYCVHDTLDVIGCSFPTP